MLLLRDLPKYETLLSYSRRYRGVSPSAIETYLHLLRTGSDVLDATEEHFSRHGTSQGRFTVLILLNRDPETPLCPADLARRAGVTKATVTGLLQGLEAEGLIKRERTSEDGRMQLIWLTRKGREYVDKLLPEQFRRISELMSGLTEKERSNLLLLLGKVNQNVTKMSAP